MIKVANAKIEGVIREIKENQAEKEKVKKLRDEIKDFEKQKLTLSKAEKATIKPMSVDALQIGDHVRVIGQETIGQIIQIKGGDVELAIGGLTTKIKSKRLEKVSRSERKEVEKTGRAKGISLNDKMANFSSRIDIRGYRAEEVIPELDQFIDDAILLNANELHILHGKGNGVLRQIVRDYLKGYKEVKSMQDEHVDRGGAGITIVQLV